MAISLLISSAVLWPFVFKKVDFVKPSSNEIIKHLKPNLTLFVPVIAVSLYTVLDKVMLGAMSSFEETGYFENAYKVATMPTAVITALGTVMLPRVSGLLAEDKREEARGYLGVSMWAAMAMAFAFSFGVAGVASVLVPVLFGDGFAPSEAAMCVIVADMPFMAWANVLRTQMLIPEGRDREYVSSVVAGAAVNVVVNLVLIPRFGALGASAGTFCAEAAVCLVQARAVRLDVPQGRWLLRCLPFVVVGAVMCIAVRALGAALGASSLTLLLQVFVGAAIYSLLSLAWCVTSRDEGYESLVRPVLEGVAKRLWGGR